jgi:hypothetical protein
VGFASEFLDPYDRFRNCFLEQLASCALSH